mgnify:CR=1 FL=1
MKEKYNVTAIALIIIIGSMPMFGLDRNGGYAKAEVENSGVPVFINVSKEVGLEGVRGDSYAWGDWNDDGYQDLLVKGSRLFRNRGPPDYHFLEVTDRVGLVNSGYSVWGDLNNDGYLDIFSVGHPYEWHDSVWINQGPPRFELVKASELGMGSVDDGMPGLACALGDLDNDGDLDCYVVNWRDDDNVKYPDVLWDNDGQGAFSDITESAGIVDWNEDRGEPNAGMGVNMGDYDNDGDLDIYVSNYLITPNYLWENQGNMEFKDVALEKGAAGEESPSPQGPTYGHTAGSQWADYDNDGDLDMWCSNLAHKDPYRTWICANSELLRNNGDENDFSFTNIRDQTGIPTNIVGDEELFFGIAWADYDNDGDLDMWIPQIKSNIEYAYSYLFENQGDGTFVDVSDEAGLRVWNSDGGAWCDYDEDGDLDLVTEGKYPYENGTYDTRLYRNQGGDSNSYLTIDLKGTISNPSAIGARVYVWDPDTGELLGMREVEGGTAGHSYCPSLTQEFGFGDRSKPVDITVRWPSGREQYTGGVGMDDRIELVEPRSADLRISSTIEPEELFQGDDVKVEVSVSNLGESEMGSIQLMLEGGEDDGVDWDKDISVPDLSPGEEWGYIYRYGTAGMEGRYDISVELKSCFPADENKNNDISINTLDVARENSPPEIIDISLSSYEVYPAESVIFEVSARDPDEDPMAYDFSADMGSFLQNTTDASKAIWIAPSGKEVRYGEDVDITITVSDGRGGRDEDDLVVRILEREIPPVISRIELSSSRIGNGGGERLMISAEVIDNEGPEGIEKVWVDLRNVGGRSVYPMNDIGVRGDLDPLDGVYSCVFTIPEGQTPGEATIEIKATDNQGLTSTSEVQLEITDRTGSEGGTGEGRNQYGIYFTAGLVFVAVCLLVLVAWVIVFRRAKK